MIDRADYTDHRMKAAQATSQSARGWDFYPSEEPPMWFRALAEVFRPRSIILLAVVAGVLSLFWIA
jgi:hypothetical protein